MTDVRLNIDGVGSAHSQRVVKRYLRRGLMGKILDMRFVDSSRDELTQLADMCVGAIARAYRDRDRPDRWLRVLWPRIDDIHRFE